MLRQPELDGYTINDIELPKEKRYCGNRFTKRTVIIAAVLAILFAGIIIIGALIPTVGQIIASNAVTNSEISFYLLDVTAFHDSSLDMTLHGSLLNKAGVGGRLGDLSLKIYIANSTEEEGTYVGSMVMPSLKVSASSATNFTVNVTLVLPEDSTASFLLFSNAMLYGETFTMRMTGDATLKALGMTFSGITLEKYLTLPGMRGLQDMTVKAFDLTQSTNDQVRFLITSVLHNPAPVALHLGDQVMSALYDGNLVGLARLADLRVVPGDNILTLDGVISPDDLTSVVAMFNLYLTGNPIMVTAKPLLDPATMPALLRAVLAEWQVITPIPANQQQLVKELTFHELFMQPLDNFTVVFGISASVLLNNPLGSNVLIDVHTMAMELELFDGASDARIATVSIPLTQGQGTPSATPSVNLDVSSTIHLSPQEQANFIGFVHRFVGQKSVVMRVKGTVDSEVNVGPLGNLMLKGIAVDMSSPLLAMDGLSQNLVLATDMTRSTLEQINVDISLQLFNPSVATVIIGNLAFDMVFLGQVIGQISTPNVTIFPTTNVLNLTGTVFATDAAGRAAAEVLFSNYLAGVTSTVSARIRSDVSPNAIVSQSLGGVSVTTAFPGSSQSLVTGVTFTSMNLQPHPTDLKSVIFSAGSVISINSPLGPNGLLVPHQLSLTASLTSGQLTLGTFTNDPSLSPILASSTTQIQATLVGSLLVAGTGADLASFVTSFINSTLLNITVHGTTGVQALTSVGNLTLRGIPLDQVVSLAGVGGLPEVQVSSLDLPANVNDNTYDGIILNVTAGLSNPSFATITLGAVSMDVIYHGTRQGALSVPSLQLVPGANSFQALGVLNPAPADLEETGHFFSDYVAGLPSPVSMLLRPTNPSATAPWLTQVLTSLSLTSQLSAGHALALIGDISMVGQLGASLPNVGNPTLSGVAKTTFTNPFNFHITILEYRMSMILKNKDNNRIGTVNVTWSPVNSSPGGANTYLQLPFSADLLVEDRTRFVAFITDLLKNPSTTMKISAIADVKASTGAGIIQVSGVPASANIPLVGYNSFTNAIRVDTITIKGGSKGNLYFSVKLSIFSNSTLNSQLGDAQFNLLYGGVYIGYANASSLFLNGSSAGIWNSVTMAGTFNQTGGATDTAIAAVVSNYMNRKPTTLSLVGRNPGGTLSPLQEALTAVTVSATLNGLLYRVIVGVNVIGLTSLSLPATFVFGAKLRIVNPLDVPITITGEDTTSKWSANPLGSFAAYKDDLGSSKVSNTDLGTFNPSANPSDTSVFVETAVVSINVGIGAAISLGGHLNGKIYVTVAGKVTVKVDTFTITVDIEEYDIPSNVKL